MRKKKFQVIWEEPGVSAHPLRPNDINISECLLGTFGKWEVERTAVNLVRFFQRKGGWYSFSIEELLNFYKEINLDPNTMFYGLLGPWHDAGGLGQIKEPFPYLVVGADCRYRVTDLFIKRCVQKIRVSR